MLEGVLVEGVGVCEEWCECWEAQGVGEGKEVYAD